jgi:hypothetical protein
MSLLSKIESWAGDVEHWFTKEAPAIQTGIADAQEGVSIAAGVATAAGAPASVAVELGKVSGGLTLLDNTVTAEASAGTLSAAAGAVTSLATGLVDNGLINVKDEGTIAAVNNVAGKVNAVAGKLTAAAAAATTPTS